jgi:hypothetical protein
MARRTIGWALCFKNMSSSWVHVDVFSQVRRGVALLSQLDT